MSKNRRYIVILIVTFVLVLFTFISPARYQMKRMASGALSTFSNVSSSVSDKFSDLKSLIHENKALKKRNKEMEEELARLTSAYRTREDLEQENSQLKKLVNVEKIRGWKPVGAKITGREPFSWNRRFKINKGESSGLKVGQAVMFGGYLVGRIKEVFNESAEVFTVADPECRISAKIKGEGLFGILIGIKSGGYYSQPLCRLHFVERDAELSTGMSVVSSGFGKDIPAGLPIGTIIEDVSGKAGKIVNNVYQNGDVYPFAGIKEMQFINVLVPEESR